MKQKTLGQIFGLVTLLMAFVISAYVLYYTFLGEVANFNMYVLWFGGGLMLMLIPLFMCLSDYCEKDEKI